MPARSVSFSTLLLLSLSSIPALAQDESNEGGDPWPHLKKFDVQVVDAHGAPIEGARVTPWALRTGQGHGQWRTPDDNPKQPPTATTDAEGMATLHYPEFAGSEESSRVSSVSCRVEHDGYADTAYNDVAVPAVGMIPIEMQRGGLVKLGGLVDSQLVDNTDLYAMWSSAGGGGYQIARDEAGFVVLPRLTAGAKKLRLLQFLKDGQVRFSEVQHLEVQNDHEYPLLVELAPAAKVEGTLSDNVPRPVVNGRVVAHNVSPRQNEDDYDTISWATWAPVRDDGTFTIEHLPPGEQLQLTALCDGYFAASGKAPEFATTAERQQTGYVRPQVFQLTDEVNRITLDMQAAAEVELTLVEAGKPIAGAMVEAYPNVGWWSNGSQIYCHPLYKTKDWLLSAGPFERPEDEIPYRAFTNDEGVATLLSLPIRARPTTTVYLYRDAEYGGVVGDTDGYRVVLESGETTRRTIDVAMRDPVSEVENTVIQLLEAGRRIKESISD